MRILFFFYIELPLYIKCAFDITWVNLLEAFLIYSLQISLYAATPADANFHDAPQIEVLNIYTILKLENYPTYWR